MNLFFLSCSLPSVQAVNNPKRNSDLFRHGGEEIKGNLLTGNVVNTPSLSLSLGKTTKGALELKHPINVTPFPIIYKDKFTKMPRWDFEDVYMQSSEARRPV